jgi:hypothetical protein
MGAVKIARIGPNIIAPIAMGTIINGHKGHKLVGLAVTLRQSQEVAAKVPANIPMNKAGVKVLALRGLTNISNP